MTEQAVQEPLLEIRLSARDQLRLVGLLLLFLLAYIASWAGDVIPPWLALAGVLTFGSISAFGLVTACRSRGWGWIMRLDAHGVTVRGCDAVPWSDLAEVVVTGMQPSWLFTRGRRQYPVVAFVPRPGIRLPAPRLPGGPGPKDRLGAARERMYGTRLVLMPHAMTASVDQIVTAARDWGHLPVGTRLPARRRRQRRTGVVGK